MGSIPVPSTKTKGCPEVARLMTSFFVFHVFCFSMHEHLITDNGCIFLILVDSIIEIITEKG